MYILCVQEMWPILYGKLLNKKGHYLDTQYVNYYVRMSAIFGLLKYTDLHK